MKNSEASISYESCIYSRRDTTGVHHVVFLWYCLVVIYATAHRLDPA